MNEDTITRFTPSKPSKDGGAFLCVIEGEARGKTIQVESGAEVKIGRRPDNDLVLASPAISKYHARVIAKNGHFSIEDLDSTNGCVVNQVPLEPHQARPLFHGDILTLGDHTLMFRHESGGFSDKTGMSTISFDVSEVREEANRLLDDWLKKSDDSE